MRFFMLVAAALLAHPVSARDLLVEKWREHPSTLANYVAGMRFYKLVSDEAGALQAAILLPRSGAAGVMAIPWTWISEDGDWLHRQEQGRFRITSGDYLRNWFTEVDCKAAEWPAFDCDDGKTRKMSVVDVNTLIFGDVSYRRAVVNVEQ